MLEAGEGAGRVAARDGVSPRGFRDAGDAESCLPSLAKAALGPPPPWEDRPQHSWATLGTSGSQLTWTTSVWPRWFCCWFGGFPVAQTVKNLPVMQETWFDP